MTFLWGMAAGMVLASALNLLFKYLDYRKENK
jgi:hypothetical protein